jgi:hypothetical protein
MPRRSAKQNCFTSLSPVRSHGEAKVANLASRLIGLSDRPPDQPGRVNRPRVALRRIDGQSWLVSARTDPTTLFRLLLGENLCLALI